MPDNPYAFTVGKCGLPAVPAVSGDMLSNATVPAPPPTIPDCSTNQITVPPADPPCPSISVASATLSYGPSVETAAFSLSISQGECCDFDIAANLDIPCSAPTSGITNQPIPPLNVGIQIAGSWTISIVPDENSCDFTIDGDISLGAPCPVLTSQSVNQPINLNAPDTEAYVSLTFTRTTGCDYDISLDVNIPCPAIVSTIINEPIDLTQNSSNSETDSESGSQPENTWTLEITPSGPGSCDFIISGNIALNIPCPTLTSSTGTQPLVPFTQPAPGTPGSISLTITQTGDCYYDFAVNIEIPCPTFTSTINGQPIGTSGSEDSESSLSSNAAVDGSWSLAIIQDPDSCDFTLVGDLNISVPCTGISSSTQNQDVPFAEVGAPGAVTLSVEDNGGCDFTFGIDINVPQLQVVSNAQDGIPLGFCPTGNLTLEVEQSYGQAALNLSGCCPCPPIVLEPLYDEIIMDPTADESENGPQLLLQFLQNETCETLLGVGLILPIFAIGMVTEDIPALTGAGDPWTASSGNFIFCGFSTSDNITGQLTTLDVPAGLCWNMGNQIVPEYSLVQMKWVFGSWWIDVVLCTMPGI